MEEIELTYLAKELPEGVKNSLAREIIDIYMPTGAEHPVLRIRKNGDKYEITKKEPINGNDSSYQLETTIPLTKDEFEEFYGALKGKRTRKIRYYYEDGGTKYEVDVFMDGMSGLVLVDVEFDSLDAKAKFVQPAWCLADVTQDKVFAGGMLCGKIYADIEPYLEKLSYKKINA